MIHRHAASVALGCAALLLGCDIQHDRLLQRPIPLSYQNGLLTAQGSGLGGACDPTQFPAAGVAILDTATPLSAFRGDASATRYYSEGAVRLLGAGSSATNYYVCDKPLVAVGKGEADWTLGWGGSVTGPLSLVMGGDLLRLYAVGLSFAAAQPQLRLSQSDIATNCELSERGAAVLTFTPLGGGLFVQVDDEVISYPATRVTVPVCAEPLLDPLPSCWTQGGPCQSDPPPCMLSQDCGQPPVQWRRDPRYEPSGVNLNLLVSTALPGVLLSRTAYLRLRPDAGAVLAAAQVTTYQFPGLSGVQQGRAVQLGRAGQAALALVSPERYLSPCAELARRRRQSYAYYYYGAGGAVGMDAPSCLYDLTRQVSAPQQQGCTYSGDTGLGCDDRVAPMAAVIELGGTIDAVVVEDTSPLLQAVGADLRNSSAQVDGILGVSVLSRLETEIDAQRKRLTARCRDGVAECRTYPRKTYRGADECSAADRHPLDLLRNIMGCT